MPVYSDLQGKYVVLTGASKGIGRQVAQDFLEQGANLYALARSPNELKELQELYAEKNLECIPIVADLSNHEDMQNAVSTIHKADILIHNAAFFKTASLEEYDLGLWKKHIDLNLTTPFWLTRLLWEKLKKRSGNEDSSIIFISSLAGVIHKEKFPGTSAYVASKMGLVGLCEAIASEGKLHHIRSNCISPGSVDTQMLRSAFPDLKADFKPQNISNLVLYLSSCISKPMTGSNIVVQA